MGVCYTIAKTKGRERNELSSILNKFKEEK
jgi:hypothetical protein